MSDEREPPRDTVTVVAIGIVVLLVGYGVYQRTFSPLPPPEEVALSYASIVKLEEGPAAHHALDLEYPQFSGLGRESDSLLNDAVERFVTNHSELFKSEISSSTVASEFGQNNLTVRYRVLMANETLVSIEFIRSQYVSGAAHPDTLVATLNWSPARKGMILPEDFFIPNLAYLDRLSYLADRELTNNRELAAVVTPQWLAEGVSPSPENYRSLGVRGESLLVFFNPYQVAPYAAGIIEVAIPLRELEDLMNPEFLVQ